MVVTGIVLIAALMAVIMAALFVVPGKEHKFHPGTSSIQALVTIFVVFLGSYWYFVERKGTAHANIRLSGTGVRLSEQTALIQARVDVENTGHILLVPQTWDIRLVSVLPDRTGLLPLATQAAIEHFDRWPRNINNVPAYYEGELQWTTLRRFFAVADQEIEPGETDAKIFDIIIPCSVRTAKLTVALEKPSSLFGRQSHRAGGWWWKDRILFDLRPLCTSPVGTVRPLGPGQGGPSADFEG